MSDYRISAHMKRRLFWYSCRVVLRSTQGRRCLAVIAFGTAFMVWASLR